MKKACVCGRIDCQRHLSKSGWATYARKHPERASFYQSPAWRLARDRHLAANPTCVVCGTEARYVDHRHSRAEGGADLDPANLQSMCEQHHRTKALSESHRGMKRAAQQRKNPR